MRNIFILLISVMLIGCEEPIEPIVLDIPMDIDGNEYSVITIGDDEWMVEDLRVLRLNNGSVIEYITDVNDWITTKSPAYCLHNGIVLYNYYCIETGFLAPKGWHVPTDDEWKALEVSLGMDIYDADNLNWRGKAMADRLKSIDSYVSQAGGRNGYYGDYINGSYWWTSSIFDPDNAYIRSVIDSYDTIYRGYVCYNSGFAVKCIRDR